MKITFILTLLLLLSCTSPKNDSSFKGANAIETSSSADEGKLYKVTKVKDGDTIEILFDGVPTTVRLEHIDCPEKKQPYGMKAKQFTASAVFGKMVRVKHNGTRDRYNRLIGEIFLPDGTNLNKELVKEGLAWHFSKYSKDKSYAVLEQEARRKKIRLWSEKAIKPEDWRKGKRK